MADYIHTGKALYLTDDRSEVVEEGDPRAAFLLVADGGSLTEEEAAQYKLSERAQKQPGAQSQAPEAPQVETDDADKSGLTIEHESEEDAAQKRKAATENKLKSQSPPNKSKG